MRLFTTQSGVTAIKRSIKLRMACTVADETTKSPCKLRRLILSPSLLLAVLTLAPNVLLAQVRQSPSIADIPQPRHVSTISLLSSPELRRALEIDSTQAGEIEELRADLWQQFAVQQAALERKYDEYIRAVLRPAQRQQLLGWRARHLGADALLTDPLIAEELQLTDEQLFEMSESHRLAASKAKDITDAAKQVDWRRLLPKLRDIRAARDREILGALSASQRTQWSELTTGGPPRRETKGP